MGWTYGYRSRAAALREALEGISVLRSEPGRSGQWVIAEGREAKPFIFVVLLEQNGSDWGWKALDETCGPSAADCPLPWLELVAEPGGFAANFRLRVRDYWASTIAPPRATILTEDAK